MRTSNIKYIESKSDSSNLSTNDSLKSEQNKRKKKYLKEKT